jgi:hypothetical protein
MCRNNERQNEHAKVSEPPAFRCDLINKLRFRDNRRTTVPLLRFASIKGLERVKDSAGLAPKSRFIAAEPIKGEVGKIGETQKATGELDSGSVGFHPRVGKRFYVAASTE